MSVIMHPIDIAALDQSVRDILTSPHCEPFLPGDLAVDTVALQIPRPREAIAAALERMVALHLLMPRQIKSELGTLYTVLPECWPIREQLLRSQGRRLPQLLQQRMYPLEDLVLAVTMAPVIHNRLRPAGYFAGSEMLSIYELSIYLSEFSPIDVLSTSLRLQESGFLEVWTDVNRHLLREGRAGFPSVQITLRGQKHYNEVVKESLRLSDKESIIDMPYMDKRTSSSILERDIFDDLTCGEKIGNFILGRRLGEGGMGRVYLAENPQIGRKVAIKFLLPEHKYSKQLFERFRDEAKILAKLHHAGIVPILDFGYYPVDQPTLPYIVMEYMEGSSLESILNATNSRLELATTVSYARQICAALAEIHDKNIIHRDLKPSNIMILPDTDSSRDSRAVLIDFGVAKDPNATSKTKVGEPVGTEKYMSPKQRQDARSVDYRTDIFSFGLILSDMLMSTVGSKEPLEQLRQLASRMTLPNVSARPSLTEVSQSLARLAMPHQEALSPDPPRGKPTLGDIVGRPAAAPDSNRGNQSVVFSRRHTTLYGDYSCAALTPNGGLLAAGSTQGTVTLWDTFSWKRRATLPAHTQKVTAIACSPDNMRIATCSTDRTLKIWTNEHIAFSRALQPGSLRYEQPPIDRTRDEIFRKLLGKSKLTSRPDEEDPNDLLMIIGSLPAVPSCLAWSNLSKRYILAIGYQNGSLATWNTDGLLAPRKPLWNAKQHSSCIHHLSWSNDGLSIATCAADTSIRIWDVDTGTQRRVLSGHTGAVYGVCWLPDGVTLASISADATLRLWHTESGRQLDLIELGEPGTNVTLGSDGKLIVIRTTTSTLSNGQQKPIAGKSNVRFYSSDGLRLLATHDHSLRKCNKMEPDILLMSPITSFYATTSLHSEGSQSLNEETLEIYKTKLRLPGSRVFVLDLKMGQQAVIELDEQGNEVSYDNRSGAIDRSYKRLIAAKVIGFAIPPRFSVQPPGAGSDNNEEVVVDNLYELAKEAGYNSNEDLNQLARWAGIDPPRETGVKGDILRRVRLMADIYRYIEKQILLEYEAS